MSPSTKPIPLTDRINNPAKGKPIINTIRPAESDIPVTAQVK
jgi:hypothetical protein